MYEDGMYKELRKLRGMRANMNHCVCGLYRLLSYWEGDVVFVWVEKLFTWVNYFTWFMFYINSNACYTRKNFCFVSQAFYLFRNSRVTIKSRCGSLWPETGNCSKF